ncbi:MAG: M12 family metallo-peptidase, partial [Kiritimatiellaeota bacterium]|nr:M12 family metallo-peptidase [Kiritimatiellota bacterium]
MTREIVTVLMLATAAGMAGGATHEMFAPEAGGAGKGASAMAKDGVMRQRKGVPGERRGKPVAGDWAVYPFFADVAYTARVTRVSQGYGGAEVIEGNVPETGMASLSIYTPEGERHEVRFARNGHIFIAVSSSDGTVEVQEHDPSYAPSYCETCVGDGGIVRGEAETGWAMAEEVSVLATGDTEVDVLIVFDTSAATWANAREGTTAFATAAVGRMNTALANSGIACTMRLAGVYCPPSYTFPGGDLNSTLDFLYKGNVSGVAAQRTACGADVVCMMVDTGSAYGTTGIGYVGGTAEHAFSVCSVRSAHQNHTMSHEVGHNFGCGHSKHHATSPAGGIAPYAAGWYFTGNNSTKYHTIMAYGTDGYGNTYQPCERYSTPLKTYQGVAVGHAADGDNARCIRERMATVAAFYTSVPSPSLAVSPVTQSVGDGAASFKVTVTANMAWSVSTDASWLTVSPASGANNGSFTVSCAANMATVSRSGTVTVVGGTVTQTVSVAQAGIPIVAATTWCVSPDGDDANGGTTWATAKKTIQAAINLAIEGNTIVVTNGTYAPIVTDNLAITIRSVNGAEHTFIDGGNTNRCATLGEDDGDNNTVLVGFTLQNGSAYDGGGACYGTLNNCTVS